MRRQRSRAWTPNDSAIWETCCIAESLVARQVPTARVATTFPPDPGEIFFATGAFTVETFSHGDDSYLHTSTWAFGAGYAGLAVGAASLVGSAIANNARRARAEANAAAQWRFDFSGSLHVSNRGFRLQTTTGLFAWDWDSIDAIEIVTPNAAVMSGRATQRQVVWRITSVWSELVFLLWALYRHPAHPQLRDGTWLPPGWLDFCAQHGYRVPLASPGVQLEEGENFR